MIVIKMRTNQYQLCKMRLTSIVSIHNCFGENDFSLQPYDAHVLFKGLYSDRATKTTEGNYMMLCNSANLMAHENTV